MRPHLEMLRSRDKMIRPHGEMLRPHEYFLNALWWRVRCDAEYVVIPNAAAIGPDAAAGRGDALMLSAL